MKHAVIKQEINLSATRRLAITVDTTPRTRPDMSHTTGKACYTLRDSGLLIILHWAARKRAPRLWAVSYNTSGEQKTHDVLATNGEIAYILDDEATLEEAKMTEEQVDRWLEQELPEHIDWRAHVHAALNKMLSP